MRALSTQRLFHHRADAGRQLAEALSRSRIHDVMVLGLARGGVPVAAEVARHLHAPLDVIVARKLGAPFSQELAIGAITSNGGSYINEDAVREYGVSDDYLASVTKREREAAQSREERFRDGHWTAEARGKTVLIVDDGLATGATMRAAIRSVRMHSPAAVIVAVPVGSPESCVELRQEADMVVCLHTPEPFYAVGLYYDDFNPTEDREVQQLLTEARGAAAP